METQITPQDIMSKLEKLQAQVNKLQEDFEDSVLSQDDIESLKLAEEEYKNGNTISHEELKKELGL